MLYKLREPITINASKFSERYIEKLLSTKKFIKESDKFEVFKVIKVTKEIKVTLDHKVYKVRKVLHLYILTSQQNS